MYLRIYEYIKRTRVEGPGLRACIWVQGCPIHCSDCAVPWTWPVDRGRKVEINELADEILNLEDIEGVTFSGGEPFLQAKELYNLGKNIKRKSDLSIMTYTGYEFDFLKKSNNKDWDDLISVSDLLIDGPYLQELSSNKALIGSSNQKIYFLSSKYRDLKEEKILEDPKLELRILPDSRVMINGDIPPNLINELLDGIWEKIR